MSYHSSVNLISLCYIRGCILRRAVQILDAPLVVLTQLQRVGVAVEGIHHSIRLQGVLQAQDVAELMSCHLQEVSA